MKPHVSSTAVKCCIPIIWRITYMARRYANLTPCLILQPREHLPDYYCLAPSLRLQCIVLILAVGVSLRECLSPPRHLRAPRIPISTELVKGAGPLNTDTPPRSTLDHTNPTHHLVRSLANLTPSLTFFTNDTPLIVSSNFTAS